MGEHNARQPDQEETTQPWSAEEYYKELQGLRDRNDPSIQV